MKEYLTSLRRGGRKKKGKTTKIKQQIIFTAFRNGGGFFMLYSV
jgi:ribosomal protein L10